MVRWEGEGWTWRGQGILLRWPSLSSVVGYAMECVVRQEVELGNAELAMVDWELGLGPSRKGAVHLLILLSSYEVGASAVMAIRGRCNMPMLALAGEAHDNVHRVRSPSSITSTIRGHVMRLATFGVAA